MVNIEQFRADSLIQNLLKGMSLPKESIQHVNNFAIPAISLISIGLTIYIFRKVLLFRKVLREPYALLELTPPATTEQTSYMTQQLFGLIHALGERRSIQEQLFSNKPRFALELISTHEQGIRYIVRTRVKDVSILKKSLLSYLPQIRVTEISEYLPEDIEVFKNFNILEFKLSQYFAFPLKKQNILEEYDPIAYATGMMTKLSPHELISFQLIVRPTQVKEARNIKKQLVKNGDVINNLNKKSFLTSPFMFLLHLPFLLAGDTTATSKKSAVQKSPFEIELAKGIHEKVDQQLFETTLRMFISVTNKKELKERSNSFITSFAAFSNLGYQSIRQVKYLPLHIVKKYQYFLFKQRLFGISHKLLLSISEVSDIYHFPYTRVTKTENMVKSHSKDLPAPLSLKKTTDLDITFAKNTYGGTITPIGLTEEERRRHMYILGATGTGKSTLLLSMITQDIKNNKGLAVIDPHGDLIEKILPSIPEDRMKDVIYFNPDDIGYPIGINLLELTPNLSEEDALREKEFIAESIISLFHKLYSDKFSGPRMEYILRNTIHTAFTTENPTLFTIYKLLINEPYRNKIANKLTDENLKDFWKYEFSKAGNYQKVKMISPITNKIGRFLFSATAKRILEQEKSSIDFNDILDNGKILLCNLSKGKIGEDNSEVFGILLMTKIQLAALKRARTEEKQRRDFYLYVDEFQNFATPAFGQILSEARKYHLNAILAHQTVSQLENKDLINVMLANTGTIICFRTANPEDEKLILPQFIPYISSGEISNLPSFHFYMKINAISPEEPFSGETINLKISEDKQKVQKVIALSRNLFAKKYTNSPQEESEEIVESDDVDKHKNPPSRSDNQLGSV